MKKNKKQVKPQQKQKDESVVTLKERLNDDLMSKLQAAKTQLVAQEKQAIEELEAKKLFEQKQREKNKSFEELLNDSNMDWKKFK